MHFTEEEEEEHHCRCHHRTIMEIFVIVFILQGTGATAYKDIHIKQVTILLNIKNRNIKMMK